MTNKKMIVMDLDGTLVRSKNGKSLNTSKESIKYLNKLKKDGYIIVIATGRNLKNSLLGTDGAEFANYIITNTGAVIFKRDNFEVIRKKTIDNQSLRKFISFFDETFEHMQFCDDNWYYKYTYNNQKDRDVIKIIKDKDEFLDNCKDISRIGVQLKDFNDTEKWRNKFKKEFPKLTIDIMQDSFGKRRWIEVQNGATSKALAIKEIAKKENIAMNDIIAFGDGPNDIEMLKISGVGVAVENAFDEVKKSADYVTKSNNEDGVIYFLKKYLKNGEEDEQL